MLLVIHEAMQADICCQRKHCSLLHRLFVDERDADAALFFVSRLFRNVFTLSLIVEDSPPRFLKDFNSCERPKTARNFKTADMKTSLWQRKRRR